MLRDIRSLVAVFRWLAMPINGVMPSEQIHRLGTEQAGLNRIPLNAIRHADLRGRNLHGMRPDRRGARRAGSLLAIAGNIDIVIAVIRTIACVGSGFILEPRHITRIRDAEPDAILIHAATRPDFEPPALLGNLIITGALGIEQDEVALELGTLLIRQPTEQIA